MAQGSAYPEHDRKSVLQDPLGELRKTFKTSEELRSELAARVKLWKRTTRELWCSDKEPDPRKWLRTMFAKINKGQLEDVSLPNRIDVFVPHNLLNHPIFTFTMIDTRGIDESVAREDLRTRIDNQRTLTVLCSEFKAAPDASIKQLLQHLTETGGDRAFTDRTILLVLPHPGDARGVTDDTGQCVESDADGYELKRDQVTTALKGVGAGELPILMFNAASENPEQLTGDLVRLVEHMRTRHVERIEVLAKTIDHLIANYEQKAAKAIRAEVNEQLQVFLKQREALPPVRQQVQDYLLSQLTYVHARTVWATTRRQGGWYNLDVYYCVGAGATSEARRRSERVFQDLEAVVTTMLGTPAFGSAHPFLQEVLVNAPAWREHFLESVHRAAVETFRPSLQEDTTLWSECEGRWGQGGGYRNDVADLFRAWFLDPDHEGLHRVLERRIRAAWREEVTERLRAICTDESAEAAKP